MADPHSILRASRSVLVVDWPSRDVPESLVRSGHRVVVHGGPGPLEYSRYELDGGDIVVRSPGLAPDHVDLVYAHRPLAELPAIAQMARQLGATAVWVQSGRVNADVRDAAGCWLPDDEARQARHVVESEGLTYIDAPYIGDVARRIADPT